MPRPCPSRAGGLLALAPFTAFAAFAASVAFAACDSAEAPGGEPPAHEAGHEPGREAGSRGPAGGDTVPPLATRESDAARDAGEKPDQVMDELGIGPGSRVADVMAGGGYYTYLLADRVGPRGTVYATGARGVERRLAEGDLAGRSNVKVVESLADVPPGSLDAVLVNRAYHLFGNPEETFFPELRRALVPGGRIGVIEVRLGRPRGHDMKTHRMGEETVREELEKGGFRLVKRSELLANPEDPRTDFMEGRRHLADRMFLVFEKPPDTAAAP